MKHLKLFAALCCAAAAFAACDKTDEPKPDTPADEPRDTVLCFAYGQEGAVTAGEVAKRLADLRIANVYLVPTGCFERADSNYMHALRATTLEPSVRLDSTRVFGRGVIEVSYGCLRADDALWFDANGWTVRQTEIEKHSVDLKWFFDYVEEVTPENIQKNLDDPTVDTVYLALVNGGDFRHFDGNNIEAMRENFLGPRIEMGKGRVRGKGNFVFYPGVALPADSLWLVQQGWTVNQAE